MERIEGSWYWCAYCGKDLCDEHEAVDTHDPTHIFVMFKAEVEVLKFHYVALTCRDDCFIVIDLIPVNSRFRESGTTSESINPWEEKRPWVMPYPVYNTFLP
jgi:hypothetical protein